MKEVVGLRPKKAVDPYEENELKGTRMPEYSRVSKGRDFYGELGWVPNFNVTFSKNNGCLHKNYREYFDIPRNYNMIYSNANLTTSEFFRQNAPPKSVARSRRGASVGRFTNQVSREGI
mmetsp:Transcript_8518/g.6339  ORF Transcript_8518/g.6339 Transcript_8518/m.6339 type:complete len:119 (-) Transcript_8518:49-405(-)